MEFREVPFRFLVKADN